MSIAVKFDDKENLWRQVADGQIASVDIDPNNMKLSPLRHAARPLPYELQQKPFQHQEVTDVFDLKRTVARLEAENAALKRHNQRLQKLLKGFVNAEIADTESF
jgi:hypothetical protein